MSYQLITAFLSYVYILLDYLRELAKQTAADLSKGSFLFSYSSASLDSVAIRYWALFQKLKTVQPVRFAFEKSCFETATKQYSLALRPNPCWSSTFTFTLYFLVTQRNQDNNGAVGGWFVECQWTLCINMRHTVEFSAV